MSTSNSSNSRASRYPNIGNLTIALLEHVVEPILGKDFIKELKLPYTNKQLRNKFRDALFAAEKEFIQKNRGSEISEGLVQLHIADRDSIQKAFWHFIEKPTSPDFPRALYKQICANYPHIPDNERISATNGYLKILQAEIVNIDREVREKVSAAVLLSLLDHVKSIDQHTQRIANKLDRVIDLLARFNAPFAASSVTEEAASEGREGEGSSEVVRHLSRKRISFDISKTLGELTPAEIDNLREIIAKWIPPLIEQYFEVDDSDRPYGKVCENVIQTLLTRVETRFDTFSSYGMRTFKPHPAIKSEKEFERFGVVNRIFKSQLLRRLPGYQFKNSAYMDSLSQIFPGSSKMEEPYGFYLVDLLAPQMERELRDLLFDELHRINGQFWRFDENSDRIQLIYISEKELSVNNWENLSSIENKKSSQNWKSVLNKATKKVLSRKPKWYFHVMHFEQKNVQFYPLDVDEIGYETGHRLEITLQEFAHFITGLAEDFLSLSSGTILTERLARDKYKDIANIKID